ncbi:hypothetical protein U1Q18_015895 [Sarracenia purpurea var. burkii]
MHRNYVTCLCSVAAPTWSATMPCYYAPYLVCHTFVQMLLLRAWVPSSAAGPMCHALLLCSVDAPTRSAGPMCHTLRAIHLFRMTFVSPTIQSKLTAKSGA